MIVLMAGMRNSFPLYRKTCLHRSINVLELKPHMLASSNMYWCSSDLASHQQLGFDRCFARMHVHGFDICSCRGKSLFSDSTELLMEPLQLVRGNELFKQEFVNILHALHVFSLLLIHDNLNQYSVSTQIQSLLNLIVDKKICIYGY
jgi:hypothetical protein